VSDTKRLGILDTLYCQPLVVGLTAADGFTPLPDAPARNAIQLRAGDLDAAFLTPIDYARESSDYQIVPGVGVASRIASGSVCIFFREELHTISSVAVDPSSLSEIILSRISLAEEFDLNPSFVPLQGSLSDLLQRADAAVLSGDECLRVADSHPNRLDLVEAWNDLSGLPYVHGFWCCREEVLTQRHIETLQTVARRNLISLNDFARALHARSFLPSAPLTFYRSYLESFSYALTEEDLAGLGEFIRYAYYHGVLPDVADIKLCRPDQDPIPGELTEN
jgi:chorismate dehydratase